MTVTIGIQTYNRTNILEIMSGSLYMSDLTVSHNIRIYDDCSTEYGKGFLEKLFPTAKSIRINTHNLKADKNMYQMYADFVSTDDDYFFNADSDIIFNREWLNRAVDIIRGTDGILSLFNANSHKPYKTGDGTLCLKNTVGAAGTLFSRNRLTELLNHFDSIEQIKGFDWQWSEYFRDNGVKIYCVNKSLVQHIGYYGQNSGLHFDVGRNYKIQSIREGQIVNDILEKYMDNILEIETVRTKVESERKQEREKLENNFLYHLKRCLIITIKIIMPEKLYQMIKRKTGSKKTGT